MTPLPPSSSGPSSRTPTIGGRVQRDVRLQAALALVVGIAIVAVPLFIWGRGKKKGDDHGANASASGSVEEAGPPTVFFGDAGAAVSIDAGGRAITFGEPRYLKCQDPGPGKTAPEKCDHLGAIEELVTKAITDQVATCLPALPTSQTVAVVVDVSFKRKKMKMKAGKDGSTMAQAQRTKFVNCVEKGLGTPNWDTVGHAHQRYLFQFLATFGATAAPAIPPAPTQAAAPGPTTPP
jgi:hypothetical protein